MKINELLALELSINNEKIANSQFATWYSLDLENGVWELRANYGESVLWVNAESGQIEKNFLNPLHAFSLAKDYAASNELKWKPSFSLELQREYWLVGACQAQLGGQTHIYVSHAGSILKHWVNPK